MSDAAFYSMYYIDHAGRALSWNVAAQTFEEQMCIYLGCCETLSRSLAHYTGHKLTVLTNDRACVEENSKELACVELPFEPVPVGIKFFASMQRLSLFKYFAQCPGYSFLIESDSLCINDIPLNLTRCVENNIPTYYDITDQVYPAYGREKILLDKERLLGGPSVGMWAGGDLIGGDGAFFQELYDEIAQIKDAYWSDYDSYFHQGDEMLVSVALEKIMRRRYVCDVGSFGGIRRYWSNPTLHVQRPTKAYLDCFLVHLPADKPLLASYSVPHWIPKLA